MCSAPLQSSPAVRTTDRFATVHTQWNFGVISHLLCCPLLSLRSQAPCQFEMAVLESGLEVPGSNASSDDTRRRCRLFSKVLQRKNREYPYLMQPNGSFAPDARPYGGKTLIIYLMVIMCLAAAFILVCVKLLMDILL